MTAGLSLLFLLGILILAGRRQLLPGAIILGAFILFVLWLTTLIETAVQLYGSRANVSGNCNVYVSGEQFKGVSLETLAYLTQMNICNCWKAAFAFEIVAAVLYVWIGVLAFQVQNDPGDD